MEGRCKEIFTDEIREKMALDIAGLIGAFYADPENVKAFEEWKRKQECEGCDERRPHP